ncbi:hypothetical protein ABW19_dt0203120 [Dactylella cylindrospora]|nr:hypothetical protein ABW19_dt0203120 [Dactylella cylindrospora]
MANKAPDRRRNNPPSHGTTPPVFLSTSSEDIKLQDASSLRPADEIRKIYLRTGQIPTVTGSSFLESDFLKLSVSVLGPRPLPRTSTTPFAAQAILTTEVKFAPFASTIRRGYIRDSTERDLGSRLYQSLVGAIRRELYPKSRIEVIVTVLDSEDEGDEANTACVEDGKTAEPKFWEPGRAERALGLVLAGCITAASTALADAGIEMYDLVSGGVATVFVDANESRGKGREDGPNSRLYIRDPSIIPPEGKIPLATCVLGYMAARDEISELWISGRLSTKNGTSEMDELVDEAIAAARTSRGVLNEAAKERVRFILEREKRIEGSSQASDVEMTG